MSLFSDIAPSREICEEMASLNLCQDDPSLCYMNCNDDLNKSWLLTEITNVVERIIAPTLPRMMEELPKGLDIIVHNIGDKWCVFQTNYDDGYANYIKLSIDKHLPNAVAKALIEVKKGIK